MAGSFANLGANLKLNISDFSQKLSQASAQTRSFAASLRGKTVKEMEELRKQTNAWGLNLKSISRVVSGIVIAQTFYSGIQSIRGATAAVWDFTKQLEYAHIAYSNLFGDQALATEFVNVLKDFAAESPFSFTEAEAAAKRLLAYGIEYKNVMYVMQGVMSAAAIQGDPAKIESISRALGQIYTYGKLMTQEVRQLSEAGIPAFEILQEELGLTQEQLRDLGNQGIPASEAINALVDGIQKRFGNVTLAAAKTVTGIISNIKDNATMLFASIFAPLTTFIKSALVVLGEFLFAMRELNELKGLGGVFEAIFPESLHGTLRAFAANVGNVFLAVVRLVHAIGGLLKPILLALVQVFNAFAPILSSVINTLAGLVSVITSNATAMRYLTAALAAAAAMWVIYKVRAMASAAAAAAVMVVSKALAVLHTMLSFVLAHPFWALLIGLGGVLVGISGGFGKISNAVSGLFKQLTSFNGINPDKVLLPSQKERANDLDKFNNKLEGTSDAMDDLADSTGKATKAAKGLLSFDEVFKLNEPDEGAGGGITDPNLDGLLDDIGGIGGGFMPEIPDFSDYTKLLKNDFLENFKGAWEDIKSLMPGIASTAIGAGFGALLGGLLGGPVGAKIGAVAGALVGYFWNMLADYFGLSPEQKVRAGVIGGVGAAIGAIFGGILGGPIGAKIGAIAGALVGSFWGIFAEKLGVVDTQHFATLIGSAISGIFSGGVTLAASLIKNLTPVFVDDMFAGFAKSAGFSLKAALSGALKQGVKGAIAGLAVGMLSNALAAWIAKELDLTDQDLKNAGTGQIVGNIAGTITGFILGGPIGSIIGGSLGQLAGTIVGEFWAYLSNTLKGAFIGGTAGLPIGALIGTLVGTVGGPIGAALGAAAGTALGALIGLIVDKWESIKGFFVGIFTTIKDVIAGIGSSIASIWSSITETVGGFLSTIWNAITSVWSSITETVGGFLDSIWSSITSVWEDITETVGGFLNDIWTAVSSVWEDITDAIGGFLDDIWSAVSTVWEDISTAVSTVLKDIFKAVETVWDDISTAISTVLNDIWTAVSTVWNDISTAISTVLDDIWSAIEAVWDDISTAVITTCEGIWETVEEIWTNIKETIVTVVTAAWDAVIEWFEPIAEKISTICSDAWEAVSSFFTEIFNTISTVCSDIFDTVSEKFSEIYETISEAVTNAFDTISEKFSEIYDAISEAVTKAFETVRDKFGQIYSKISEKVTEAYNKVSEKFSAVYSKIKEKVTDSYSKVKEKFSDIYSTTKEKASGVYETVKNNFSDAYSSLKGSISDMYEAVKNGISDIYERFTGWISDMWDNVFGKLFGWIDKGISKLKDFFSAGEEYTTGLVGDLASVVLPGHATGGIFNREHIASFAEGNKAEAVIPLENASAMQPFVDAVANGLTASLGPMLAGMSGGSNMPPMYVGTLIADDRSLKELERRMEVIRMQEGRR